ncbi:MAG: hypothetical protein Q4G43_04515 [Mobilicoccus sp.]|nr:hypothetical protein [Mobilicoccus sp.]
MSEIIQTDSRGRAVLSGRKEEYFLKTELEDGTIVLKPGVFVTVAQHEYDTTPELQQLLSSAAASPTVRRSRRGA